jgi:glycogen phosphorylase
MIGSELAKIRVFEVVPSLPAALQPLLEVAHNLWWAWHPEAVELFVRIDPVLWSKTNHNPVKMLGVCPQERLDQLARDEGFLTSLDRARLSLKRHMERTPWLQRHKIEMEPFTVAYFCSEFGINECLQIYSGGLGCLAGDHLKSASELALPLVGVGLLYRNGYFQQYLNNDGWQQEYYPELDFSTLPIKQVIGADGHQVKVSVKLPGREVFIAVWKASVGRIPLYLLDTNLPENNVSDRGITGTLYGGDMEHRIKQELVLGIGGTRALLALGIEPDVCHMNEGHSAFLALERIRNLIAKYNVTFDEARQRAAASHVFTTHTPVPAGIDRFPPEMITRYFAEYVEDLKLDMEGLLALGRENTAERNEHFSMAVLAIRTADYANGVSRLHGEVSRDMWKTIWPGVPVNEVPIGHVTNGVHARSWMSGDLTQVLDRYLGSKWTDDPSDQTVWKAINEVPDEELWRVHERRRQRLIIWTRKRLRDQLQARGVDPDQIQAACDALSPNALTIGFARRFATYKRGTLILKDAVRLKKILNNATRPVQILIAGKSHPADGGGKDLIRQIVNFARETGHKIVFIENYDIHVARYLIQGCDIWLNTPRRGMEASGTSGMKAALNGVLNLSILDGWWDEACQNDLGWAIGRGETYANYETQDLVESQSLYQNLEEKIIPLFYQRDDHNVPRAWIQRMKKCISVLAPMFNTNRMVKEYAEQLYLPALRRSRKLNANNLAPAIEQAKQKQRLHHEWGNIAITAVRTPTSRQIGVNQEVSAEVEVTLGALKPDEVRVQACIGPVDNDGRISSLTVAQLTHSKDLGEGKHLFTGSLKPQNSGRYGVAIRVIPGGELMAPLTEPGLIKWDKA